MCPLGVGGKSQDTHKRILAYSLELRLKTNSAHLFRLETPISVNRFVKDGIDNILVRRGSGPTNVFDGPEPMGVTILRIGIDEGNSIALTRFDSKHVLTLSIDDWRGIWFLSTSSLYRPTIPMSSLI